MLATITAPTVRAPHGIHDSASLMGTGSALSEVDVVFLCVRKKWQHISRETCEGSGGAREITRCDGCRSHATPIDAWLELRLSIVIQSLIQPLRSFAAHAVPRRTSKHDYARRSAADEELDDRRMKVADTRYRIHIRARWRSASTCAAGACEQVIATTGCVDELRRSATSRCVAGSVDRAQYVLTVRRPSCA